MPEHSQSYEQQVKALEASREAFDQCSGSKILVYKFGHDAAIDRAAVVAASADREVEELRKALEDDEHYIRLADVTRTAVLTLGSGATMAMSEETFKLIQTVAAELQAAVRVFDKRCAALKPEPRS